MSHPMEQTQDALDRRAPPSTVDAPRGGSPYTDLTPHAKGGLGEVLKATDTDLHRTVAVKRLQDRHADDPASQHRFLLEAEITARLEHPGVVPVYGLVRNDPSGPCYAMRFIEGQTLAEAITAYHAGPADPVAFRRLLQCFLQVCQTVAYAHSRGVIHRDLKPANVMLGKFGETLVVDWGLAKVVGRPDDVRAVSPETTLQPAGAGSGDETALGSAVGTPAFMSPEQAAGRWDVIDAASDIYGLGAVLYTLLAGRTPFARGNWPELLQKIQRGDFPRPRQVKPDVPRALEAISLKAMALEPGNRYSSAQALAADVEHWLADEPVAAWQEPVWAKGWRWMRRHKTLVSVAAALVLTGLAAAAVGLVLLGQKNQEVAAERNAARAAADQAQAVNDFLTEDLLGQADPDVNPREKKVTVEELLHKASQKIDGNPEFAAKPELEATLRLAIGKTYFKLRNDGEAERHLKRAVELRRGLFGPDDRRTLDAQAALGWLLAEGTGNVEAAVPLLRQTWEGRARILGDEHPDTLRSLGEYAYSLHLRGDDGEAEILLWRCLKTSEEHLGWGVHATLSAANDLGVLLTYQGRCAEAEKILRRCLPYHRKVYGETATDTLSVINNLALALLFLGKYEEAEQLARPLYEQMTKTHGPDHLYTLHVQNLLAEILLERNQPGEAERHARQCLEGRREKLPAGNANTGRTLLVLGRALALQGHPDQALPYLKEATAVLERDHSPKNRYYAAWAECWNGVSLANLRRHPEAEPQLLAAEAKLRAAPTCPPQHYRQAVEQLVKLYDASGKPEEAAKWRKELSALSEARETSKGK